MRRKIENGNELLCNVQTSLLGFVYDRKYTFFLFCECMAEVILSKPQLMHQIYDKWQSLLISSIKFHISVSIKDLSASYV